MSPREAVDLVSAKARESLMLELLHPIGGVEVSVFDARGRELDRYRRTLGAGVHGFQAPPSGMVEIRRR